MYDDSDETRPDSPPKNPKSTSKAIRSKGPAEARASEPTFSTQQKHQTSGRSKRTLIPLASTSTSIKENKNQTHRARLLSLICCYPAFPGGLRDWTFVAPYTSTKLVSSHAYVSIPAAVFRSVLALQVRVRKRRRRNT